MNNIKKFLSSLYFGDRFCERMEIVDDKIVFQINCISRLEEGTTEWNYYVDRDINHGCLIFEGVTEYRENSELEFNDEIYNVDIVGEEDGLYSFLICGCNVSDKCVSTDLEYHIKAKKFYIFDPEQNCNIVE